MLSADDPSERSTELSMTSAGTAGRLIPLRPAEFYAERRIDLVLNARVSLLDAREKSVQLETARPMDTCAADRDRFEPVRLEIPGAMIRRLITCDRSQTAGPSPDGSREVRSSSARASSACGGRVVACARDCCMSSRLKASP
jgi:hypothetical protein